MNYLMNTLKLSIYGLLWGFPVPIILALLLNRIRKTGIKKKVQLLIYMPNFISVIVLCGMVRMLLSPVGPLNKVLGISTNWMTMPSAFRTIYIASGIWQAAGWSSIMYTAALANASKELEEAATMDGANLLQQIWYVELPAIKNIIVIQFILQAGNIMSIGLKSICFTDRHELAGIRNPVYICISYWTSERRLWIFDSGRSLQLGCKCYLVDLCKLCC